MPETQYLNQSEALDFAKRITGRRPAPSTFVRWRLKGIAGVKLRYLLIQGKPYTTEEWLLEFWERSGEAKATRHSKAIRNGMARAKQDQERASQILA